MEFKRHDIKYSSKSEWFNIIPLGDIHLGNSGCDLNAVKDMIKWIHDKPNTFWIGMGDYIDAINYSDPRFDPKTVSSKYLLQGDIDKIIQMQIEDIVDLLNPVKDKCLGLLRGNHEEAIRKHYHYDVLYEIAKDLDIPRSFLLYDTAVVRLGFHRDKSEGRHVYDIFCAHGNVGGRTYGYKANRVHDLHKYFQADIYLMAHSHIKQVQNSMIIFFNSRNRECKRKVIDAYTGCFLRGYERGKTSYVEKWLYPPTDIGCVKIMLQPYTGDKHASI